MLPVLQYNMDVEASLFLQTIVSHHQQLVALQRLNGRCTRSWYLLRCVEDGPSGTRNGIYLIQMSKFISFLRDCSYRYRYRKAYWQTLAVWSSATTRCRRSILACPMLQHIGALQASIFESSETAPHPHSELMVESDEPRSGLLGPDQKELAQLGKQVSSLLPSGSEPPSDNTTVNRGETKAKKECTTAKACTKAQVSTVHPPKAYP